MLTHLEGKHQKSKGESWNGLRKGTVHLVAHSLPGLSLPACSKSPPNFHQIFQGFLNEVYSSYSQITAAASTRVVCFLSAVMPLQSIGLALYNMWSHLCFQFSTSLLNFCCDTSVVWHLLIFLTQHTTCPNSPAMTNSPELFFLMSCLVTLHAFQCSYRYQPFHRYIHSS